MAVPVAPGESVTDRQMLERKIILEQDTGPALSGVTAPGSTVRFSTSISTTPPSVRVTASRISD